MESKHYKGIYFNDDSEIPQFEFGAHFKYTALYQRLEELKSSLEKNLSDNNLLNTPFNNNYNFEIKKMTNIKYSLSNGFIKDSRNVKNIHKANRTCAMSLIGHNTKKTKEIKATSVNKERSTSKNIQVNRNKNISNHVNAKKEKTATFVSSATTFSNFFPFHTNAKSRNRSHSNNNKVQKEEKKEASIEKKANNNITLSRKMNKNNNCNYSKLVMIQHKESKNRNGKYNKTYSINTKNENTISYQVRDNKKNNNYGYVDIKSKNTNIKVKRDNSLIKRNYNLLNIFNPFQEKKMKLLFSKKRDASSNNKNYRTNISTSVSKEKKNNTIFSQDIKHNYSKSSLSQNKTNRIQYTNINSYFNTGGSNKINKKNTNNTSTLSSSNNNNSQSTNNKKIII